MRQGKSSVYGLQRCLTPQVNKWVEGVARRCILRLKTGKFAVGLLFEFFDYFKRIA